MPPLSYIFWILMLLWALGSAWYLWPASDRNTKIPFVLLLFLLFVTVGLKIFR